MIADLKRLSRIKRIKEKKLVHYFFRGGQQLPLGLKGISLDIKNRKLAKFILYVSELTKKVKTLRQIQSALVVFTIFLFKKAGITFAAGGSLTYVQIIFLMTSSSTIGALIGFLSSSGGLFLFSIPILTMVYRYKYISQDNIDICKLLCEVAKTYHNKELAIEMGKFTRQVKS